MKRRAVACALITAFTAACDDTPTDESDTEFTLVLAAVPELQVADSVVTTVELQRRPGFTAPVQLSIQSLPAEVTGTLTPEELSGSQTTSVLVLRAGPFTSISNGSRVIIRGDAPDTPARLVDADLLIVPAPGLVLDRERVSLRVGGSAELMATLIGGANGAITWESSRSDVADVNSQGRVTAQSAGVAIISASLASNPTLTAAAEVQVTTAEGGWSSVAVGEATVCALTTSGDTYCWGWDAYGQTGSGEPITGFDITRSRESPTLVTGNYDFVDLSVGHGHACGRTTGDDTYCWGANSQGQLGSGQTSFAQPAPTRVSAAEPLASVAAGSQVSCGLTRRGMAMCWGDPYWGGQGPPGEPPQYYTTPQRVWGAPQMETIALAELHACGIEPNGDLWCWGRNGVALGTGNPVEEGQPPVRVNGGPWVRASVRGGSCALDTNSAIWCWGDNQPETGQSLSERATPTLLPGAQLWRAVSVGGSVACGLTTQDTAWCWGANEMGQLATGNTESVQGLAEVGSLRFVQLSAGEHTVCGVTYESRLFCWGRNTRGELGDPNLDVEYSATPLEVAAPH